MFATPDDAEQAYYDAFNRGSAVAMREVWLDDDAVVCVHPRCGPLHGYAAVVSSWEHILAGPGSLQHELLTRCQGPRLAVHTGIERAAPDIEIAVTNVFQLVDDGWRMLLHHASPAPKAPQLH